MDDPSRQGSHKAAQWPFPLPQKGSAPGCVHWQRGQHLVGDLSVFHMPYGTNLTMWAS